MPNDRRAAQDARLALEVRDDGPGPSVSSTRAEPGSGVGLENTRRRLAHLYGDESRLELLRDGDWTRLVVELPFPPAHERDADASGRCCAA